MKVIWTDGAAEDPAEHVSYIARDSPESGRRIATAIYERAMSLSMMPQRGRRSAEGLYELLVTPWPYVIVYEILNDAVVLQGIRHAAQDTAARKWTN